MNLIINFYNLIVLLLLSLSFNSSASQNLLPAEGSKYLANGGIGSSDILNPIPLSFNPALIGSLLKKRTITSNIHLDLSAYYNDIQVYSHDISISHPSNTTTLRGGLINYKDKINFLGGLHIQTQLNPYLSFALAFKKPKFGYSYARDNPDKVDGLDYGGDHGRFSPHNPKSSGLVSSFGFSYEIGTHFDYLKGLKLGYSVDLYFGRTMSSIESLLVKNGNLKDGIDLAKGRLITKPFFFHQSSFGIVKEMGNSYLGIKYSPSFKFKIEGDLNYKIPQGIYNVSVLGSFPKETMEQKFEFESYLSLASNLKFSLDHWFNQDIRMSLGLDILFWGETPLDTTYIKDIQVPLLKESSFGGIIPNESSLKLSFPQPIESLPKYNTWLIGFGFEKLIHSFANIKSVYSGLFYESSGMKDNSLSSNLIDSDKFGFGLGFDLLLIGNLKLSLSYAFLHYRSITVNQGSYSVKGFPISAELDTGFGFNPAVDIPESGFEIPSLNNGDYHLQHHYLSLGLSLDL